VLPEVSEPTLSRSVLPLDSGDTCIRWCGSPAHVTAQLVETAMTIAAYWTNGPGSPPWLIGSNALAPNHWFSTVTGACS